MRSQDGGTQTQRVNTEVQQVRLLAARNRCLLSICQAPESAKGSGGAFGTPFSQDCFQCVYFFTWPKEEAVTKFYWIGMLPLREEVVKKFY